MPVATVEKPTAEPALLDAEGRPALGADGFPVRYWPVETEPGVFEERAFSLRPYADAERPTYWHPNGAGHGRQGGVQGQLMFWRDHKRNRFGFEPIIQQERWNDGRYSPRNDWEVHMTETWMLTSAPGCADPRLWRGSTHPEGPGHHWRCDECSWICPNWECFKAHQRYLSHRGMQSE